MSYVLGSARKHSKHVACSSIEVGGAEGVLRKDSLKILIVDDERDVARHLADGLRLLGFRTEVAHAVDEALSLMDALPEIGVVIADMHMPGGDGLRLAEQVLRERHGRRAVRVILITAFVALADGISAGKGGVSALLYKPFGLAEAARAARGALDEVEKAREAGALPADASVWPDELPHGAD